MQIEVDILRKLLDYNPENGKLFWKSRGINDFDSEYANKEAFTSVNSLGYIQGEILGKNYKAHRVAWAIYHGHWPENIDHINGIKTDNRILNLREVSNSQNSKNMKRYSTNTSGVTGVRQIGNGSFQATICVNRKRITLGSFKELKDAIKARKEAEILYGFHENHGR